MAARKTRQTDVASRKDVFMRLSATSIDSAENSPFWTPGQVFDRTISGPGNVSQIMDVYDTSKGCRID
jgi:hypothetical protein